MGDEHKPQHEVAVPREQGVEQNPTSCRVKK
jgi:hypothetical protein